MYGSFKLEIHVKNSLQTAWALAGGRPLNANHLLKGALLEARTRRSKALLKLASLLPIPNLANVKPTDVPPADLAALPLTKPLADSFSVAEGFFKDKGVVWGPPYG